MANLPETEDFAGGTYQIETSDRVIGGPGGIANKQAEQLGNRTAWLRAAIKKVVDGTTAIGKATQLASARTLKFKGSVSGSGSYDGSADTEITLTLADSGVAPGAYTKVSINAKGLVTAGDTPSTLGDLGITNAYTKAEVDDRIGGKPTRDAITTIGFASDNVDYPYMRRESDNVVYYLQRSLGFIPVQQGTGVGQKTNTIKIGYSPTGVKITVDATDFGNLWYSGNFDPNSKANWGSSIAAYGITNAYTKDEVDSRLAGKPLRDAITSIGLAGDRVDFPYMRRESDGGVYYLQARLGFVPVQQGTGVGQSANLIKIGHSPTGVKLTVDAADFGNLWYSGNFDPNIKANWGSTLSAYGITDAYTKLEVDARVATKATRDSITHVGLASDNPALPYVRRESDGLVYYLQSRLGFAPVQQGTGVGQSANLIKIGHSPTGVKLTVDAADFGNLWYSGNFDPNTKANWGSTLAAYGIMDAYNRLEVDTRVATKATRDAITHVGLASDNPTLPYVRRESDGQVIYLICDMNINARVAAMGLSAVGSHAFARLISNSSPVNQGGFVSGTNLLFSSTTELDGTTNNSGVVGVGTWRAHGALSGNARTLFQRIS